MSISCPFVGGLRTIFQECHELWGQVGDLRIPRRSKADCAQTFLGMTAFLLCQMGGMTLPSCTVSQAPISWSLFSSDYFQQSFCRASGCSRIQLKLLPVAREDLQVLAPAQPQRCICTPRPHAWHAATTLSFSFCSESTLLPTAQHTVGSGHYPSCLGGFLLSSFPWLTPTSL